ncbi:MAG TPA: hypothetical protein VK612_08970 [Pyrinomonadaceae bacterium]|nr:hypothetical protein [Pyrinomonadaceae bacterium]
MKEKKENELPSPPDNLTSMFAQGWIGLAFWMSFGLLIEGLIAFRIPAYLQDPVRRELFRLGHAHGTLLSIVLLIVGLYAHTAIVAPMRIARLALQAGVIMMPVGFILGGISHFESDPNPLVFLAPLGGLLVIFGVVSIAVTILKK